MINNMHLSDIENIFPPIEIYLKSLYFCVHIIVRL